MNLINKLRDACTKNTWIQVTLYPKKPSCNPGLGLGVVGCSCRVRRSPSPCTRPVGGGVQGCHQGSGLRNYPSRITNESHLPSCTFLPRPLRANEHLVLQNLILDLSYQTSVCIRVRATVEELLLTLVYVCVDNDWVWTYLVHVMSCTGVYDWMMRAVFVLLHPALVGRQHTHVCCTQLCKVSVKFILNNLPSSDSRADIEKDWNPLWKVAIFLFCFWNHGCRSFQFFLFFFN